MSNNNVNAQSQWTDQDMIGDLLIQEKQLIGSYSTNLCEGSVQPLRQMFTTHFEQATADQFNVFQQMQQRGWYQTKPVQGPDLQAAKQRGTEHKNMMIN